MAYRDNDERNYRQDRSRNDHDNRMGRGGRESQQGGGYRSGDDRERYSSYGPGGHPNCPTYGHPNCSTWPG